MLVWVASYPRSGNAFFRVALHQLYGYRSVKDQTRGVRALSCAARSRYGTDLWTTLSDEEMMAEPTIYFVKTHHLPRESESPAVYLLRDGRDALVSYAWFTLIQDRGMTREDIDQQTYRSALEGLIISEGHAFGDWSRSVRAWLGRPNTAIVRFEELIKTPVEAVTQAIERLSLPISKAGTSIPTFDKLREDRPLHYRRGMVGSWKEEFPPDLLELFWERHGEAMQETGYSHRAGPR